MKINKKLVYLIFLEVVFSLGIIISTIATFKSHPTDFWETIVKKKTYIIGVLEVFSIVGILLKKSLGWIMTALIFYIITIAGCLAISKQSIFNIYEIGTFLPFISAILLAIIFLHSIDLRKYFRIEDKKLIIENMIVGLLSIVVAIVLMRTNG